MVSFLALAAVTFPLVVRAHMAMWHPSMYGFDESYTPVTPLAGMSFNQWWFHGFANDRPSEVMTLIPGQDINIEIACSKRYSSWGDEPNPDGCPSDAGSFHAGGSTGSRSGWGGGNSEPNLIGCALAIAFKSTAAEVQPEDFTVMSVQERCVRQRDTPFAIPANLPACPPGGCTCSWFWQGKNSADEMYMIGFRCDVQGGVVTNNYPRPVPPRRGSTITGPTQPMYWANSNTNLDYTPNWSTKPSYNSAFGWLNGAQTSAFGPGGGGGGATNNTTTSNGGASVTSSQYGIDGTEWTPSSTSSSRWGEPTGNGDGNGNGEWTESASSTSSRRRRPRPSSDGPHSGYDSQTGRPTWYNHNAVPTPSSSYSPSSISGDLPESPAESTSSPSLAPSPSPSSGSGGKTCKRRSRKRRTHRAHAIAV